MPVRDRRESTCAAAPCASAGYRTRAWQRWLARFLEREFYTSSAISRGHDAIQHPPVTVKPPIYCLSNH